jgi:DNA-binding SARP family transcriptional activator
VIAFEGDTRMSTLRIHLLGRVELSRGQGPLPGFATQKSRSIFAFLAMHRSHLVPRDVLIGAFWPEQSEAIARKSLRSELWRIRSALDSVEFPHHSYLRVQNDDVSFDTSTDYWLDVEEFEGAGRVLGSGHRGTLKSDEAELLGRMVGLYRGDLLDGIYDEWCLFERERLKLRLLEVLERLMYYHCQREEWHQAIGRGRELLHHDPLREHIHRDLMRCHTAMGNRPGALLQFEECARLLRRELGIAPMEETVTLRQAICSPGTTERPLPASQQHAPNPWWEIQTAGPGTRGRFHTGPAVPATLPELVEGTLVALNTATAGLEQARLALSRASGAQERPGQNV